MAQLGTKIVKDIRERFNSGDFPNEVGEEAGRVHKRSIEQQTANSQDPTGSDYFPLSQNYKQWKQENVGSGNPDLRSGKRYPDGANKPSAFDNFMYEPDGKEIDFNFGSYGEAEKYMGEHQLGTGNLPERRWFPDSKEGDGSSQPQQQNADKVAEIIEEYLNQDRVIKARTVIS